MHILMVNVNMVINSRKVICIKLMMSFSSTAIDHLRSNEWSGPCSLQIHQLSWKKKKVKLATTRKRTYFWSHFTIIYIACALPHIFYFRNLSLLLNNFHLFSSHILKFECGVRAREIFQLRILHTITASPLNWSTKKAALQIPFECIHDY